MARAGNTTLTRDGRSLINTVLDEASAPITLLMNWHPEAKKYDETIRQIKNAGEWPPAGLDYHVCFGSDGNLKVSEIWNSREQFEAFGKRLMPILAVGDLQLAAHPLLPLKQELFQ